MHPVSCVLDFMPLMDFAVLTHGFLPHGRDYFWLVENGGRRAPGRHELVFTHCVQMDYETRVGDQVWPASWTDELTNYEAWQAAGEPDGYVWGTNWSLAYPGLTIVEESPIAAEWTRRIGREFYEITLETDRFFQRLIFHSFRHRKIDDNTDTIDQVIQPL